MAKIRNARARLASLEGHGQQEDKLGGIARNREEDSLSDEPPS